MTEVRCLGLFDKFRKRIQEVTDEVDESELTSPTESKETQEALKTSTQHEAIIQSEPAIQSTVNEQEADDDWDDFTDEVQPPIEPPTPTLGEDEWDSWDDGDDNAPMSLTLSKKERKRIQKEAKRIAKTRVKTNSNEQTKPVGSRVDLSMMRSTTGRQLVKVEAAPRGSKGSKEIESDTGQKIAIDLGGGIVEAGGKVIKQGQALDSLLEELEWVLLESDISSVAVTAVMQALRRELLGSRLRKGAKLDKVIEASLKRALHNLLQSDYWDFNATVDDMVKKGDTPVIIMMVGVNGTGKTTTAAKIAHRMKQQGHSVIAAAADTFRAGAIEQLETHCERLDIRCISSQRGGDSAAISRDAVESARARGTHVVLIDTAGRMQNKSNLMNELSKVHRVCKPHLVLFVGDALAGNDAVDQAVEFQKILDFDGAVLTKLDTDAKGGAALSIAHSTGRPIVMAGVGQEYDDLKQFDPDWLLDQLFE
jgi:fused signal recognition particle receptor